MISKIDMLKRGPHRPPHLLLDDHHYFLTGAVRDRRRLLSDDLKDALQEIFDDVFQKVGWILEHWVILDNHYHLLAKSLDGSALPSLMRRIHSRSGYLIRQHTRCDPPVWYNYWDYCLRSERDYYRHLNYLLYNPVKHGYVDDLKAWRHSSFPRLLGQLGRTRLAEQFKDYPEFRRLDVEDDF